MTKHHLVALLPMKANSERVPGKNFKNFIHKPLFEWILDTLLSIQEIELIVINTDATDILRRYESTRNSRVLLRDRSPAICGDFVSMNKILEDDLTAIESEHFLMTHTTNPLISAGTLIEAIKLYKSQLSVGFDSLFSVNKYQSRFYFHDLKPVNHDPKVLLRTQDLDPIYEENSCFYLFNKQSFEKNKARIGNRPFLYPTPGLESVDIDDETSWKFAEINYKMLNKNEI